MISKKFLQTGIFIGLAIVIYLLPVESFARIVTASSFESKNTGTHHKDHNGHSALV